MRLTSHSTAYFSFPRHDVALAVVVLSSSLTAFAQIEPPAADPVSSGALVKSLGMVTVNSGQPTSLPTQIPTTMEGVTREQIDQTINATDSEDALKYLPSLLVRKRYIGDYNHAILSSRASGTGNSARSAVYADGILLSNYLGNGVGGLSFPPRWGLVTPEEIERVDVMYRFQPPIRATRWAPWLTTSRACRPSSKRTQASAMSVSLSSCTTPAAPTARRRPAPRWAIKAATGSGSSMPTALTARASR